MMPQLPSLGDLPQAQFDRIVAAFPGATTAEKAQNYKDWSINNLIDFVELYEVRKVQENSQVLVAQKIEEVRASLPAKKPWPPGSGT